MELRLATSPVRKLTFPFSLEKVINAVAYFASEGVNGLTKLKALKLLYLADRHHLYKYGRPITGDRYIAMDLGPVPEGGFQLISRLIEPAEVEDAGRRHALERLDVRRGFLKQYPLLRARTRPDMDVFSDSEADALAAVVGEFGQKTARELVELTHRHRAYQRADADRSPGSSVDLPYEYFFDDAPESARVMQSLAEGEQEDRDFARALQIAGHQARATQPGTTRS